MQCRVKQLSQQLMSGGRDERHAELPTMGLMLVGRWSCCQGDTRGEKGIHSGRVCVFTCVCMCVYTATFCQHTHYMFYSHVTVARCQAHLAFLVFHCLWEGARRVFPTRNEGRHKKVNREWITNVLRLRRRQDLWFVLFHPNYKSHQSFRLQVIGKELNLLTQM